MTRVLVGSPIWHSGLRAGICFFCWCWTTLFYMSGGAWPTYYNLPWSISWTGEEWAEWDCVPYGCEPKSMISMRRKWKQILNNKKIKCSMLSHKFSKFSEWRKALVGSPICHSGLRAGICLQRLNKLVIYFKTDSE